MSFEYHNIVAVFQIIGVCFGFVGLFIGLTKGRHASKMTGGGIVAITVKYLLIATAFFLIGFLFNAVSFLAEAELAAIIGAIVMFGEGLCFFVIFWELSKYMDKLKTYV